MIRELKPQRSQSPILDSCDKVKIASFNVHQLRDELRLEDGNRKRVFSFNKRQLVDEVYLIRKRKAARRNEYNTKDESNETMAESNEKKEESNETKEESNKKKEWESNGDESDWDFDEEAHVEFLAAQAADHEEISKEIVVGGTTEKPHKVDVETKEELDKEDAETSKKPDKEDAEMTEKPDKEDAETSKKPDEETDEKPTWWKGVSFQGAYDNAMRNATLRQYDDCHEAWKGMDPKMKVAVQSMQAEGSGRDWKLKADEVVKGADWPFNKNMRMIMIKDGYEVEPNVHEAYGINLGTMRDPPNARFMVKDEYEAQFGDCRTNGLGHSEGAPRFGIMHRAKSWGPAPVEVLYKYFEYHRNII
jgi:hypothetical protein